MMIIAAPTIWKAVKLSCSKTTPATTDTTVETPMKDAVRLTPIFAIAIFDRKNARIEQPNPW